MIPNTYSTKCYMSKMAVAAEFKKNALGKGGKKSY